jgi:hypothetical protein
MLFLFFTLSGSRRSYYVLPIVPFAILFIADWLQTQRYFKQIIALSIPFVTIFLLMIVVLGPTYYYRQYGIQPFSALLKKTMGVQDQAWHPWQVVFLNGPLKLNFYLQLPTPPLIYTDPFITSFEIEKKWPILQHKPKNTIFITRQKYAAILQPYFKNYRMVAMKANVPSRFLAQQTADRPVAYVPLDVQNVKPL